KIIALSQYHKSLIPKELHHKVYVSSNGIVPKHFKKVENALKIPKRIIWTSSYNRGLETILRSWKEIRQAHPDAEIHIFYGWQVYDQYVKEGYIKDGGWKDTMLELMKQRGVYEHGRMGHEKLLEEYAKSSVFAYPCNYSGEINCVSLTKAIACGCNVVTNKFAVMAERSPNAVEDKKFIPELIRVLGETNKKKVDWDYIHDNSWATIAKDWKENLFAASV
ncbi:MAG: glycosyltransferase, partial [Candidatus Heimdallarchaeaceae archaeon]